MSNPKNHIDKLSPELIEQYQNGTLSEEQQYQVELLMLNSSFDEEAMEGFESFEGNISSDLQKLNSQLEKRIAQEKKDTPFFWIKIAASILILALSSYLVWDLANDENVTPLSINEAKESSTEESSLSTNSDAEELPKIDLKDSSLLALSKEKEDSESEVVAEPVLTESKPATLPPTEPRKSKVENKDISRVSDEEELDAIEPELIADNTVLEEVVMEEEIAGKQFARMEMKETAEPSLDALKGKAAGVSISKKKSRKSEEAAPAAFTATEMEAPVETKSISGVVTSANNQPLPGVNVVVKGTTIGTVTNLEGKYELHDLEPETANSLVFSSIGLETEEVRIGNREVLNVKMNENVQQLSEVVVSRSADSNELKGIYKFAQPEIGISEYKKYLKDNIQYPADQEAPSGRVVVTFDVNTNGSLSNFIIKRSLGDWQDKEAIRLIQEGPKWNPSMNGEIPEPSEVRVVVKFEDK